MAFLLLAAFIVMSNICTMLVNTKIEKLWIENFVKSSHYHPFNIYAQYKIVHIRPQTRSAEDMHLVVKSRLDEDLQRCCFFVFACYRFFIQKLFWITKINLSQSKELFILQTLIFCLNLSNNTRHVLL